MTDSTMTPRCQCPIRMVTKKEGNGRELNGMEKNLGEGNAKGRTYVFNEQYSSKEEITTGFNQKHT